jgi:hypothetical protein
VTKDIDARTLSGLARLAANARPSDSSETALIATATQRPATMLSLLADRGTIARRYPHTSR